MNDLMKKLLIDNISLIIHSAATTKFNENLKLSLEMNVLGVQNVLCFAKQCKKLISMVHISTAYVNCIYKEQEIFEELYPSR